MKIIIITKPDFFAGETDIVNALFAQGMPRLHLRKPKATQQQMAEWIEQIAEPFRHLIVVHDHHILARHFALGGIHLNNRNPDTPEWVEEVRSQRSFTLSRSCHTIAELEQNSTHCDYMFLSPIFDSISKEGYGAAFARATLSEAVGQGLITDRVYALGGIAFHRLQEVHDLGFSGAAILGDLWMNLSTTTDICAWKNQFLRAAQI